MRRFHFRLQHVLNMRAHARKQVELRLGVVTAECNALDIELEALAQKRTEGQKRVHGYESVLRSIQYRSEYIAWIDQESTRLQALRAEAEMRRLAVVDEYNAALQQEKVLQKLKERREKEYYRSAAAEEERHTEDLVSDGYIRGRGLNG